MSPGMYLPAYISPNIGSSSVLVPVVHLIHYLTRTAEQNINSSQLKQGITPRTLKVRMNFTFFLLGYVLTLTRDFVGILQVIVSTNGISNQGSNSNEMVWRYNKVFVIKAPRYIFRCRFI